LLLPNNLKIGIIGLGYVGLPLAVEFGKHYSTTGFDLNQQRIQELKAGEDKTCEVSSDDLKLAKYINYSDYLKDLADCNFYIIAVPTPLDKHKNPDLTHPQSIPVPLRKYVYLF
jgi:UDP-N-acetyl-D-galactosamine dehydrogenase